MEITIVIMVITCIVSFVSFSDEAIKNKLIFYPPYITEQNQWYRFITHGLIHADIPHLAFNMISFYFFGRIVELQFKAIFPQTGILLYILMYVSALIVSELPSYFKHKNNYNYASLGASGAVSAVVFIGILLRPSDGIRIFPIPFDIPGFVFAPLFIIISAYLDKKGNTNIGHSAHIWGALYGVAFMIVTCYFLSDYRPVAYFIEDVKSYINNF